jgi:hypothetical protein
MIVLFVSGLYSVDSHQTPIDRIAISHILEGGELQCESESLSKGQMILLTITSPYGTLSMATHQGYSLYVGLIPLAGGPTRWFTTGDSPLGVLYFGANKAIIEIAANTDTKITYTTYFVGNGAGYCASIRPASSDVIIKDFSNSSSRHCFVATDESVDAEVSGSLGSGEIIIHSPGSRHHLNSPSSIPVSRLRGFHAIQLSNEGLSTSSLNLSFRGNDPAHEHDEVTQDTPAGVIGKGWISTFNAVTSEPSDAEPMYPMTLVIWCCCLGFLVLVPLTGGLIMSAVLSKRSKSDTECPELHLFDSQAGIAEPSPPVSTDIEREDVPDSIPASPYDTDPACV